MLEHEQILHNLVTERQRAELVHKDRMTQWEYFDTPEYREELRQRLLQSSHADITPPWFTQEEDKDEC